MVHICFISLEYFEWGRYGGIGKATRDIASEMVKRNIDVSVVVPLGFCQKKYENIEGVNVYGYPLSKYPLIGGLFKKIGADIYHSQDPTPGTWFALKHSPNSKHLLTCQNPRTGQDWVHVNQYYPFRRKIYNKYIEPVVNDCVKQLDRVYCQARYTINKARQIFNLDYDPVFLPNPVCVPEEYPEKSDIPTVLFLGRFDKEKKPEVFMNMAEYFPDVRFIAAGASHDKGYDYFLRKKYSQCANLVLPGFVEGNEKIRLLNEAWILVNTSISECLPVSFLEAAAHGCSILSPHDPDDFTSSFGEKVPVKELVNGLSRLLDNEWREKGEKGYRYVKKYHEKNRVIEQHLNEYDNLL